MNKVISAAPVGSVKVTAPWVIVSASFHFAAGQAKAVAGLADYLARSGTPVHLVGNTFDPAFVAQRNVTAHGVAQVRGADVIGNLFLGRAGMAVAHRVKRDHPNCRVVVNGGNCLWGDVNWVHYLHHAWKPQLANSPFWFRLKERVVGRWYRQRERKAIQAARLVLTNSQRTTADVLQHLEVSKERLRTVYYGSDPSWSPPSEEGRRRGKLLFGLDAARPLVVFVAGLGYDNRKGFDTLLEAWRLVCQAPDWDADLVLAGGGKASGVVSAWLDRAGLTERVRMVGFTDRVFDLLAAADLLVSPVRYEPYGLNVQEAICRGLPALVSAVAGVAEEYPVELAPLLLQDANDPTELASRLRLWRSDMAGWRERFRPLSERLRSRSWDDMARDIVAVVNEATP